MSREELQKSIKAKVCKVDEELGIVFGFSIISKVGGEPYYDLQGDFIPESAMLEASSDFMQKRRAADDMHDGEKHGEVVFAFPLTTDIAESLGIQTEKTGLLIGMKPSPEVFEKFRSGERKAFSIGGVRL